MTGAGVTAASAKQQRLADEAAALAYALVGPNSQQRRRHAPRDPWIPVLDTGHGSVAGAMPAGPVSRLAAPTTQSNPLVESAYADLRLKGLSEMAEADGAKRLMQHGPRQIATLDGYAQKFQLFKEYCETIQEDCFAFTVELAFLFASYMTTRISRTGAPVQSLRTYFSAFNFYYTKEGLGTPWQSGAIKDLNNMFESASKVWRIEHGFRCGNLRTEIPGAGIALVVDMAVAAVDASKLHINFPAHPDHKRVAWLAVFLVMLIFWFRADTIAGYQPGDIIFNEAGAMNFVVRRLKRGTAHVQPFSKSIPTLATSKLRQIFAVIWHAVALRTADGQFWFSSYLWGTKPQAVSDCVTKAMDEMLDYRQLFIPEGSFISSHSWRRTGASAYAACRGDWHLLKRWGMWRAITSAEAYINLDYAPDPIVMEIFPWLFNLAGQQLVAVPGALYESISDLAGDGLFATSKI